MSEQARVERLHDLDWTPSIHYAESYVACSLQQAWNLVLDYPSWNPSFVGAEVIPVSGPRGGEGEVVQIKKQLKAVTGDSLPPFYAKTVKLVPLRHIAWYVYPMEGDAETFRNFVDFGLSEVAQGLRFSVNYYAQARLTADLLSKQRAERDASLGRLVLAFKRHCEGAGRSIG
jgi:hypothetical protein